MAATEFTLNNPLCFLTHRFGKNAVKVLKSAMLDFYGVSELVAAKHQLLKDIRNIKTLIQMPHVPERRDDVNQATRVVDDVFTVMTYLDENLLMKHLPKYVADSPDSMPSTRLYEGDLMVIMNILEKLSNQIADHGTALAAIVKQVRDMQTQVQVKSTDTLSTYSDQVRRLPGWSSQSRPQPGSMTAGNSSRSADQSAVNQSGRYAQTSSSLDWAAMTSSPIPTQRNRYAVLATTDDDEQNAGSAGDEPFIEQRPKRAKRQRNKTDPDRHNGQDQQERGQHQEQHLQQQSKRLLVGKGSINVRGLAAAKKLTKKSVFCIDNVNTAFSADDLRSFVSKMKVNVISCFEVKPRRRRDETEPILDRKAFRLCVESSDRGRLLDDRHWPESVMISEWYFLPPYRERRSATSTSSASVAGGHSAVAARSSTVTTAAVSLMSSEPAVPVLPSVLSSVSPVADDAMDTGVSAAAVDDDFNDTTITVVDGDQQ